MFGAFGYFCADWESHPIGLSRSGAFLRSSGHACNLSNFKTIDSTCYKSQLRIVEALHILSQHRALNQQKDTESLVILPMQNYMYYIIISKLYIFLSILVIFPWLIKKMQDLFGIRLFMANLEDFYVEEMSSAINERRRFPKVNEIFLLFH